MNCSQIWVNTDIPASHYETARIRYSVAGREIIDILPALWRHDAAARNMPGYGLGTAAGYFGIGNPASTPIHGHHVYKRFQSHPARVRIRAMEAVRHTDNLSRILMPAYFGLAGMTPRSYSRITTAGPAMGILEPMLVRAYYHEGAALLRSADLDNPDLRHSTGGASYLFRGGVVRRVVKCDIASMYPSIMTLYNIGSQYDRLGVLVSIVSRLMEMRLEHKRAGRVATAGSASARAFQALSAGLKIIINSAYGYLAAGGMAILADVDGADAITARSRVILDQVVEGLRRRGMILLEADIDGAYFSVPAHYTEADERTLVREVAAELPDGIRLEFEGRYQAMLSNMIKNYALLTYDDRVIIRGSGLVAGGGAAIDEQRDYDTRYYIRLLRDSYLARLRKAFRDEDYRRLFRENGQRGIFDQPTAEVGLVWVEDATSS